MTMIELGLLLVAGAVTLACAGAVMGSGAAQAWRVWLSGASTCVVGLGGLVAGVGALAGGAWSLEVPRLLPLSEAVFAVDALSGLFMALVGAVAVVAGIYSIGYPRTHDLGQVDGAAHGAGSRTVQVALPLFTAAMVMIPAAGNVTTFLVLWELMALVSLILVLTEHRTRPEVTRAGLWYAATTHAGLVAILIGLVVFANAAGAETFTAMRAASPELTDTTRSLVFLLVFAGLGSKAGLVPLHVGLLRADPEAPSHVAALMSAAMVTMGLYGVLRVGFDLLGGGPRWWWLLVLAVGAFSAVYGVLQAGAATDLMRLLAYSTTENLGLIFVGLGAAGLFAAAGNASLASLLMIAALLHAVNHAAFKTLLFLGAGSVLRSTGLRDLDAMGGLGRRMPITAVLFGLGALGASGLPPGNGFVSEWLLLQGLIHSLSGSGAPDVAVAIAMPLAVGVVALTAGLGVALLVKAFGVGFLARPRSAEAAAAVEVPRSMRAGMVLAAVSCATLALAPLAMVRSLEPVLVTMPAIGAERPVNGAVQLQLSGITGSMSPVLIALGLVGGAVLITVFVSVLARLLGGRRPRRTALVWGSGGSRLSPRMQYTATAYAEPLTRVFDDVLRPENDIDITHHDTSHYLVQSIHYRQRVSDRIENRLYPPLVSAALWWAAGARRLQNGSVHRYLAYGLVGLLVVLIAVGVTS